MVVDGVLSWVGREMGLGLGLGLGLDSGGREKKGFGVGFYCKFP